MRKTHHCHEVITQWYRVITNKNYENPGLVKPICAS